MLNNKNINHKITKMTMIITYNIEKMGPEES